MGDGDVVDQPKDTKRALWLGLSSLLLGVTGPFAVYFGVRAWKSGARSGRTAVGFVTGAMGSLALLGVMFGDTHHAAPQRDPRPAGASAAPGAPAAPATPNTPESPKPQAEPPPQIDPAVVQSVDRVAADAKKTTRSIDAVEKQIARKKWRAARTGVDDMEEAFAGLGTAPLTAPDASDPSVTERFVTAAALRERYHGIKSALRTFEMEVFDAAFDVLWAPENATEDEDRLLAKVGRKFKLPASDVKAIVARYPDEMDRRLKARSDAEAARKRAQLAALEAKCGRKPSCGGFDGGCQGDETIFKSDVEVSNCSPPRLDPDRCWLVTCDVKYEQTGMYAGKYELAYQAVQGVPIPVDARRVQ